MDTDEKKQECFLNGLDDGFTYTLEAHDIKNFQTMVDKALVLENKRGILTRKCKLEHQTQQNTNLRPHISSSLARPVFCPVQQSSQQMPQPVSQGFVTPQ
jgi:ABC-type transporter Mla maintaining outer membrane lipid asymmetry ATPase subunit MlaF